MGRDRDASSKQRVVPVPHYTFSTRIAFQQASCRPEIYFFVLKLLLLLLETLLLLLEILLLQHLFALQSVVLKLSLCYCWKCCCCSTNSCSSRSWSSSCCCCWK
jgi:hypothetical protein